MSGAIYMAAAGAMNNKMRLEIISNNIANVNTSGYKEDRINFKGFELIDSTDVQEIKQNTPKVLLPISMGTRPDFASGAMQYTGNKLDVALDGDGFFSIKTPDGIRYTRSGNFTLNNEGLLVTQAGFPVLGDGGEIKIADIDDQNFIIDEEGSISIDQKEINLLKIVDFSTTDSLKKVGDTLFAMEDPSVSEITPKNTKVKEGFLEGSNVNAVRSMINMIDAIRGYETYQKIIRSIDEVTGKTVNEVGRIG